MDYSGSGALEDVAVVPTNDIQIPPGPTPDSSNSGCGPGDFVPASRPRTRWPSSSAAPAPCPEGPERRSRRLRRGDHLQRGSEDVPGDDRVGVVGTLEEPGIGIPVIGIRFKLGRQLCQTEGARVSLDIQTKSEIRQTANIIADTKGPCGPHGRGGRPPRLRSRRPWHKRQRERHGDNARDRPADIQTRHRADQQGPLRLLGRGGVRPLGSEATSRTSPIKNSTRLPSTSTSTCSARPTSCASSTTATARDNDPDDAGPAGSTAIERVFKRCGQGARNRSRRPRRPLGLARSRRWASPLAGSTAAPRSKDCATARHLRHGGRALRPLLPPALRR